MQDEEHDALLAAMSEQLAQLQAACARQLTALDMLHTQEEQAGLVADQASIEALCKQREAAEADFLNGQLKALQERQEELQQLRAERAEECRMLRTRLDTEVNSLEQACASEKAANLLEAEELKLAHEKLLLDGPNQLRNIQAHTLRISRAQQLLATMKRKYAETEEVFAKENAALSEEFQMVTQKLRELQAREGALHLSAATRYREVQRMKHEELSTCESQLQAAIREVSLQLLSGGATDLAEEDGTSQAGSNKRSWQLLERVLSRTCAAWQSAEGEQQQLARLQKECKVLQTELAY